MARLPKKFYQGTVPLGPVNPVLMTKEHVSPKPRAHTGRRTERSPTDARQVKRLLDGIDYWKPRIGRLEHDLSVSKRLKDFADRVFTRIKNWRRIEHPDEQTVEKATDERRAT